MNTFRDLHSNRLTGTVLPLSFSKNLNFVNLASNFFVGNIPQILGKISADFRFNYLSNCSDELCCLTNSNCSSQCFDSISVDNVTRSLPLGIESSTWSELNVFLYGKKKQIIQIETHFTSVPHLLTSHACPNTSALILCDSSSISSKQNQTLDGIQLIENVPYVSSQSANVYRRFVYFIKGNVCTTSIKVH